MGLATVCLVCMSLFRRESLYEGFQEEHFVEMVEGAARYGEIPFLQVRVFRFGSGGWNRKASLFSS